MNKLLPLPLLLLGLSSQHVAYAACTESWKEPYVGNTLGGQLEAHYSRLLASCGIPAIKRTFLSSCTGVSSIPLVLQQNLPLEKAVKWDASQSLGRHFAYVYPTKATFGKTTGLSTSWLLYEKALEVPAENMLAPGSSNRMYSHDCTGVIAAAAAGSANLNVGVTQFQAATNAEFMSDSKTSIVLTAGRFDSPFLAMLSNNAPAWQQVKAGMLFYGWYRKFQEPATPAYLLSSVKNGVVLFSLAEKIRRANANISGEMSTSIGVASLGFKTNSSITDQVSSQVKDFVLATDIADVDPSVDFVEMPSPVNVAAMMQSFPAKLQPITDPSILPGTRAVHVQRLPGVEPAFCKSDTNGWKITPAQAGLNLVQVQPITLPDNTFACDFVVEFVAPATFSADGDEEIKLAYQITASQPMVDKTGGFHYLSFPATAVTYQVNKSPEIVSVPGELTPKANEMLNALEWRTNLVFRDNSGSIKWDAQVAATMVIKCDDGRILNTVATPSIVADRQTAEIIVRYTVPSVAEFKRMRQEVELDICNGTGTLSFRTKGGRAIPKPYFMAAMVPRKAATQAAAPAPAAPAIAAAASPR